MSTSKAIAQRTFPTAGARRMTGGLIGAAMGARTGALVAATLGKFGGPQAAAICGVAGAVVGAVAGYLVDDKEPNR